MTRLRAILREACRFVAAWQARIDASERLERWRIERDDPSRRRR